MTSLAKQLQKLAIPGQPSLRHVTSKKKPSLLFDPKEAADIDIDTIFSLGVNGLEELISIDRSFTDFETSLFQESCKDFERTVQMKDVLEDLDEAIASFLRRLSPYFLLKPAQKCLEWLIRAFRVTSFNVDAVMECILPYYETKLFARVVQLLPLKDPSSTWHWLRPIQRAGSPLSKLTLVQHCISVQPFLVFVCEMVPRSLKVHKRSPASSSRTVVAFYVSTVSAVLETETSISEELVSRLLPFILKGLKSSNVEYRAASYMVTSQLSCKSKLQEQLYCSLVETICKHLGPELTLEGLTCIGVICTTQQVKQLSHKAVKHLMKMTNLVSSLSQLSQSYSISSLLSALLSSLLENHFSSLAGSEQADNASLSVLLSLVEEIQLKEQSAYQFVKEMLEKFSTVYKSLGLTFGDKEPEDTLRTAVRPLAQSLDAKYPTVVDRALEDVFASLPHSDDGAGGEEKEDHHRPKRRKTIAESSSESDWLHCFISLALPQSRHQLLGGGCGQNGGTLVLSVHHHNPSMRAAAVRQLGKSLQEENMMDTGDEKSLCDHKEFATSALLGRLGDDDPSVVQAVLSLKAEVLFSHLPADELVPRLCHILTKAKLHKPSNSDWQSCALLAIDILMSQSLLDHSTAKDRLNDVIVASLPFLFVHRHSNKFAGRVASTICDTSLGKQHPLFSRLHEILKDDVWLTGCEDKSSKDPHHLAAATCLVMDYCGQRLASMTPQRARELGSISPQASWLRLYNISNVMIISFFVPTRQESHARIFKLLSADGAIPSSDHMSYYTSLTVAGYALKYLSTTHKSDTEDHEQAIALQMAIALRLLPHIRENLVTLSEDEASSENADGVYTPDSVEDVFALLTSKHPNKHLSQSLLLLCLLKTLSEHLLVPPEMSTSMWLELPVSVDPCVSESASLEHLYYQVVLSLFSLLTRCVDNGADKGGRERVNADIIGGERVNNDNGLTRAAKRLLQLILTRLFTAPGSLLRFLAMIWTVPTDMELGLPSSLSDSSSTDVGIGISLQACSLAIAGAYLQSLSTPAVVALVGAHCPVVPSLLIPLMSTHRPIREAALNCMTTLQEATRTIKSTKSSIGSTPFIYLLEKITDSRLELEADPTYLQQLLGATLSAESHCDIAETPTKRKRKRKSTATVDVDVAARSEALPCLLMHVAAMGAPAYVQYLLLSALEHVEHTARFDGVLPLLVQLLNRLDSLHSTPPSATNALSPYQYLTLRLCIGAFEPYVAAHLQTNGDGSQLLVKLVGTHSFGKLDADVPTPQELAINQVTRAFFDGLGSQQLQQSLLQQLIDALLHTKRVRVSTLIKDKVKKLQLPCELVVTELTRHFDQLKKPTRKSRSSVVDEDALDSGLAQLPLPWRRLTSVMELIQQTSDIVSDAHQLVPHLFSLLKKYLEVPQSLRLQLEYTQQLLLSSLLHICSHLTTQGLDAAREVLVESQFNVELVVQCIRLSPNPQTHHHALLLLSNAATIFPNRVLHNIMPVFTFMGAHLLHQDDQYSFQIITKTIDNVIPPLIKSGSAIFTDISTPSRRQSSKFRPGTTVGPSSVQQVVKEIIHVFVDALPHVPAHRRLPLFTHLLATVGVDDYLHVALGLLVEKQVIQASLDQQVAKEIDATFPVSLALEFPLKNVLLSMLRLAEYLAQLPEEKPTTNSKMRQLPASVSLLFNVAAHSDKQLKQFKAATLSFLLSLLSQNVLTHGISTLEKEDSVSVESTVVRLLECVLSYASRLSASEAASGSSKETSFRSSLLKKNYLVVDKVFSLLSIDSFIAIVSQLVGGVSQEGVDIQRKSIDIFNSRLESGKLKLHKEHDEALLNLVERLLEVIEPASTHTLSRHSALRSIQLLTRRLGSRHSTEFFKVAKVIGQLLCGGGELSSKVLGSCLLCAGELCKSLGPHAIPLLPNLVPHVLKHLQRSEDKNRNDSLQLSAANCLGMIIDTLPKFLSSFITDMITTLCHSKMVSTDVSSQLSGKVSQIRLSVSVLVSCRTLLPAYHKCYPDLLSHGKESICALLGMLSSTVSELKKEDVKNHSALLIQMFLTMLDYRATQNDMESSVVEAVEGQCVQAFSLLVVKLSEALFRPMFLQLIDWATHPSSPKDRLITFYHLTDCIAEKLNNLFLLFAGHMIRNVAALLDSNHIDSEGFPFFDSKVELVSEDKSCLLLQYILQTLTKCFLYDRGGFLTKERFETLLQPLVNQVTNTLGGSERYRKRVESHLAPCLANFAVAAGKDSLWKPLNQQLLVKSRHSDSQVRFALLKALQEVYTKLGEEFVVLLPETIPFLAELMEDECEEVEQQAQALIDVIENIIGESIQQYF